jgi:hypothetical protein
LQEAKVGKSQNIQQNIQHQQIILSKSTRITNWSHFYVLGREMEGNAEIVKFFSLR